jgi:hypothetical protein
MFPGFDFDQWDDRLDWFWQWSNLRFIGFYLAHRRGGQPTTWITHWHDLKDVGWGTLPLYVPFKAVHISNMSSADGTADGQEAVGRARTARMERNAAIYLDIETAVFDGTHDAGFAKYVNDWMQAVRIEGYVPGVYCSYLDAHRFLTGSDFATLRPALWPFAVPLHTRAGWDDARHQLAPNSPNDWLVSSHGGTAWPSDSNTIGCQYDQFNAQRDRKVFTWCDANGHPATGHNSSRSVDWDMSKTFDPSHPRATAVVAAASDRFTVDWFRIFRIGIETIVSSKRDPNGTFSAESDLRLGPGEIGPRPTDPLNGFDPVSAAVVSRRNQYWDLFVLGQDGFVRTTWVSPQELVPHSSSVLNLTQNRRARRGSPIAAVSRVIDQLDVFYVGRDHRLLTSAWRPGQKWSDTLRVVEPTRRPLVPLVAGGSNLMVLPTPSDANPPSNRLDVLYVTLDFNLPVNDPHWNDSWQVIHGVWTPSTDWQPFNPVPDLNRVAASSRVAAVTDNQGNLHIIVQTRDRASLRHGILLANTGAWNVQAGPGSLPTFQSRPVWWMSLHLIAIRDLVVLVGLTSESMLAWATYPTGGPWSTPTASSSRVQFATNRPLVLARLGTTMVDVFGVNEEGEFTWRRLNIAQNGTVNLMP